MKTAAFQDHVLAEVRLRQFKQLVSGYGGTFTAKELRPRTDAVELLDCRLGYDPGLDPRPGGSGAGIDVEGHWRRLLDLFNRYGFIAKEAAAPGG